MTINISRNNCVQPDNELLGPEAATVGDLFKKVFLKISQNPHENICARVSLLIKLQAYFSAFVMNTERYGAYLPIQSEAGK